MAEFQVVSQAGVLEQQVEKHGVRLGEIKCKPVAVCRGRGRIGKVVLFMTKQEFGGPGTAVVSVVRIPQDLLEKGMKTGVKDSKKAMKAMKMMKRVSIIAKNKRSGATGLHGDLCKNKRGRIVSRKRSVGAKKRFSNTLGPWLSAVTKARKALNVKGFVACNGKTAQGRALYAKAKSFYSK